MEIKCAYSELVQIEKLVPNPKNRNKHSEKQISVLSKIIEARGWRHPIIVSNRSGFIVAGHGRLEAAKLLCVEKVPVDYQDFENEADEYAVMIADNEIARYAEFDKDGFIEDLQELDIDLQELDFEDYGLLDFDFNLPDQNTEDESETQKEKKYLLEIQLGNELDLRDLYDDLVSKGYMVKER